MSDVVKDQATNGGRVTVPRKIAGALGCAAGCGVAILGMETLAPFTSYPLGAIPFATSIVLVLSQPNARPAQPRALIGGHLISAAAGLLVSHALGASPFAAAIAVGLAVLAMILTDTLHPPAGISPLLVVSGNLPLSFLIVPVLTGACLLAAFSWAWHRFVTRSDWPDRSL